MPDRQRRWSLRSTLIIPFTLLLVVAVGSVGGLSIRYSYRTIDELTGQLRTELTERISGYLLDFLETPHRINELNAAALTLGQLDFNRAEDLSQHLWHQLQEFTDVSFIFVGTPSGGAAGAGRNRQGELIVDASDIDPEIGLTRGTRYEFRADERGRRLEETQRTADFDARQRPWFIEAVTARQAVWSDIYLFFAEDTLALAASRPVFDENQELLAVLGAEFSLTQVDEFLRSLKIGQTGQAFIVESSGFLVASSTEEPPFVEAGGTVRRRRALESQEELIAESSRFLVHHFGHLANVEGEHQLTFRIGGRKMFLQITPLRDPRGLDWLIVTTVAESDFTAEIAAHTRETLALTLIALAVVVLLALITGRRIERPIQQLGEASRQIAAGNLEQQVEGGGIVELQQLAGSFNQMSVRVRDAFDQLEARVEQRTAELSLAKEEADQANRAKSRFLADVSHDVRTPLAAILGYAELLRQSPGDAGASPGDAGASPGDAGAAETYLRAIRDHGEHLNRLLSDLLDIGGIEAGRLEIVPQSCELLWLLEQLRSQVQPRVNEKGLSLRVSAEGTLPWRFTADGLRLRQVLTNLLANAVAYTERGGVTLRVRVADTAASAGTREDSETTMIFEVEDTGIGISPQDQERLFERFTRLAPGRGARQTGFGLGLSICQQLVALMGGHIELSSQPNQGSSFAVYLPVNGCAAWSQEPATAGVEPTVSSAHDLPRLTGRVLMVDDSRALLDLGQRMLQSWGLECVVAENGRHAVNAALETTFDLVLMDWQMPEMDGLEATTKLRRMGDQTPIIALTAVAMPGDRETCLAAGCNDYLIKPIDFTELRRRVTRLLAREDPPAMATAAASGAALSTGAGDGRFAHDPELEALMNSYLAELPAKVETVRQQLQAADWPAARATVHRLAGTAGTYGLSAIFAAAERLEGLAASEDAAAAGSALQQLALAVERAIESG